MIVSDDQVSSALLVQLVASRIGGDVVAVAHDAAGVRIALHETPADVLVLDLSMPGAPPTGLDLLEHIHARYPALEIVVHSAYDSAFIVDRSLKLGARHFVSKGRSVAELANALCDVVSTRSAAAPAICASTPSAWATLTTMECLVMNELAAGHSVQRVAASLHCTPTTIRAYKASAKRKLGQQFGPKGVDLKTIDLDLSGSSAIA